MSTITAAAAPPISGVSLLSPNDERWRAFAAAHADSPLQQPGWLDTLVGAYHLHARIATLATATGEIVAGLPMVRGRRRTRWTSLPFTDALEPIAVEASARDRLLLALARRTGEAPLLIHAHTGLPGWTSREVGTVQVLGLEGGLEGVLSRADAHHRRSVKRARREDAGLSAGPIGSRAEFLGQSLDLTARSRRRLGAPTQPRRYWARLWELHERGDALTVAVRLGDQVLANGVFIIAGSHAVYKYGASDEATRHLRTNFLMFATAFELLAERGVLSMDLGISDLQNTGLRQFKTRWGGEERPMHFSATDPRLLPDTLEPGRLLTRAIQSTPVLVGRALGSVAYPFAA